MAYATPLVRKQNVFHFYKNEVHRDNERNLEGWRSELDGKIVELEMDIKDFLNCYVPSGTLLPPDPSNANPLAAVPVNVAEEDMYDKLCTGLTGLVSSFPSQKRPSFYNNNRTEIKFPFLMGEQVHHSTQPDVVASLPGQRLANKLPNRWRNISVVFELKSRENQDPLATANATDAGDKTLIQLAKSARNLLIAGSRLFVFAVGIYGPTARIFRFDRAGAICTEPFSWKAKHGAVFREFLWRLVHPIPDGCDIVGADPTVRLVTPRTQNAAQMRLKAGNVVIDNETMKACRWMKVKGDGKKEKTYLLYELLFMNSRLFSRATMIWKALELTDTRDGWPTGKHVIIKDAWRQLARKSEMHFYRQIYAHHASRIVESNVSREDDTGQRATQTTGSGDPVADLDVAGEVPGPSDAAASSLSRESSPLSSIHSEVAHEDVHAPPSDAELLEEYNRACEDVLMEAWATDWPGLAIGVFGHDLGEEEEIEFEEKPQDGHRTCTGIHQVNGKHQWYERSHMRLVSNTIGTPLSEFKSTKELVGALRDAIRGHQLAFEAGIMHRDISEGNVMIANGRGFLHDLDYGFNWKAFLRDLGYEDTEESWARFVETEEGIPRAAGTGVEPAVDGPSGSSHDTTTNTQPRPPLSNQVNGECCVGTIVAERGAGDSKMYLVRQRSSGSDHDGWWPRSRVEGSVALTDWLNRPRLERKQLSALYSTADSSQRAGESNRMAGDAGADVTAPSGKANAVMECKQRTGTFYFMAVEVLRRGIIHQVRHDLESFYWLLIWLILRHTKNSVADPHGKLKALFDQPNDDDCVDTKRGWLGKEFTVDGNPPLNYLLEKFSDLCADNSNVKASRPAPVPLTYKLVLDLFDKVLKREDWPVNDAAIPFKLATQQSQSRLRSTWLSAQDSEALRSQGGLDVRPPAHPRGVGDGELLLKRAAALRAQSGGEPPHTPPTVGSGSGAPAEPWSVPLPAVAARYQYDSGFASPSSHRDASAGAAMGPPPIPRSPSPDFTGQRLGSVHDHMIRAYSGEARLTLPSAEPPADSLRSSGSENRKSKSNERKRTHEDVPVGAEERTESGPSKRSRTRRPPPPPSDRELRRRP